MKVKYDAEVDALVIRFSDAKIDESDEDKPDVPIMVYYGDPGDNLI